VRSSSTERLRAMSARLLILWSHTFPAYTVS
jgi:hypothetical protein